MEVREIMQRRAAVELNIQIPKGAEKPPLFVLYGDLNERLSEFSFFERGILRDEGGLRQQDAAYMEDMLTLRRVYGEEYDKLAKTKR